MSLLSSSNIPGTSIQSCTIGRGNKCITVMKCPDSNNKKLLWKCKICNKDLSSKRSYTEHMNIHNKTRPFRCDNCEYAAASQMTLHRHKLRNHTPKTKWGYRCVYCDDTYMEPAGYQQHIQHRHAGLSATYGCPLTYCRFVTKSQRHFIEHISKHEVSEKTSIGIDAWMSQQQMVRFMVNDECGAGHEKRQFRKPVLVRPRLIQHTPMPQPAPRLIYGSGPSTSSSNPAKVYVNQKTVKGVLWTVEKPSNQQYSHLTSNFNTNPRPIAAVPKSDFVHVNGEYRQEHIGDLQNQSVPLSYKFVASRTVPVSQNRRIPQVYDDDFDDEGPPVLDRQQEQETVHGVDPNWIETEIEVDSNDAPRFPNGFMEEELD